MKFWQYFLFTIIGALLGFGLQFIIDNGGQSWVIVKGDYPSGLKETGHEGEKPYTWTYRLEGRSLELPKRDSEGNLVYPGVPELPEKCCKRSVCSARQTN